MNKACTHCGLLFEREPGYFLGAMMVSYGIAVIAYTGIYFLLGEITTLSFNQRIVGMVLIFLPFVPGVFRISRIVWIYFDQIADPHKD